MGSAPNEVLDRAEHDLRTARTGGLVIRRQPAVIEQRAIRIIDSAHPLRVGVTTSVTLRSNAPAGTALDEADLAAG